MREYPYEKCILLNTAYDVLERLAYPLEYADSRAGVLRFACETGIGEMDLTAILQDGAEVTRVEIIDTGQEVTGVLYDEIASTLCRTFETARRDIS